MPGDAVAEIHLGGFDASGPCLIDTHGARVAPPVWDLYRAAIKRLAQFFGYQHRFEAYVPKEKRVFGYFAQPVLVGDEIVAVLDLKTDRERQKLLVQKWTWVSKGARAQCRKQIEEALHRFERFQLAR